MASRTPTRSLSSKRVGTDALVCPVERSSTGFSAETSLDRRGSGLGLQGQPRAAVPILEPFVEDGTAEAAPSPAVLESQASFATKSYDQPSEADRYQMIRTYFQMLIEEELPDAVGKMKQFASWFTHGVPGGAGLRKAIYESKSAPEILSRVEEFFESRLSLHAAAVTQ